MDSSSTLTSPKRRAKFAIGGLIVLLAVGSLVGWAMSRPGSTAFYMTPTELQALGATDQTHDYRMNGKVVPGSIERDGLNTRFLVSDGDTEITVHTDAPLPDTFRNRSEVVAKGHYDGSTFAAQEVLAKCPSKFKAKEA
ncbi:MAG TPA: cytochrome c maturation protein CcmE [Actinomycetota bacterium]|nr:cytochrome c maturation protein CcmE [Actinomycetota bacterium]